VATSRQCYKSLGLRAQDAISFPEFRSWYYEGSAETDQGEHELEQPSYEQQVLDAQEEDYKEYLAYAEQQRDMFEEQQQQEAYEEQQRGNAYAEHHRQQAHAFHRAEEEEERQA
jgi:hypothetical protein